MRFHHGEAMTAIENYIPLAKAAEASGFSGFSVPDSLIYPKSSDTQYSYTDDGGRQFLENKPFLETLILATAILTATERLELTTNVLKLPVRPPLYVAKQAASIAALSGNRFNLGVGLSVWPEDYAVMGVGYEKRGKRMDECIEIVRGLTTGEYYEFHGEFYDLSSVKIKPVPTKPLPILIGGHSDAALRRAAVNDGWICAGAAPAELGEMQRKLEGYRRDAGTLDKPFRVFATAMGAVTEETAKVHMDLGVTDMIVAFRNLYAVEEDTQPLSAKLDDLKRFADTVVGKF